jgi:hypothetical protein
MLQIACGKESSNDKVLQIAFEMEGSSSKILQMAFKMEGSSSQKLQIACKNGRFQLPNAANSMENGHSQKSKNSSN